MKIDVMVEHKKGFINIRSEIANISLYEPSIVLLVKAKEQEKEKIESIGHSERELREEMKKYPEYNEGKGFRFLDPFNIKTFDPFVSACVISFYCLKIHHLFLGERKFWQQLLGLYNFDLTISIAGYFSLSHKIKKDFINQLKAWKISNPVFF